MNFLSKSLIKKPIKDVVNSINNLDSKLRCEMAAYYVIGKAIKSCIYTRDYIIRKLLELEEEGAKFYYEKALQLALNGLLEVKLEEIRVSVCK